MEDLHGSHEVEEQEEAMRVFVQRKKKTNKQQLFGFHSFTDFFSACVKK